MQVGTIPKLAPRPLMRRFLIFYIGFSLIPLMLLFFLFLQHGEGPHKIAVSKNQLGVLILLVGSACLLGYFSMHALLSKFVALSGNMRRTLAGQPDKALLNQLLADEEGEVAELAKSFNIIVTQLESNITELEKTKETLQQVLSKVGQALTSMEDFGALIRLTLETAIDALGAREAVIFSRDERGHFALAAIVTEPPLDEEHVRSLVKDYLHWVEEHDRTLVLASTGGEQGLRKPFDPPVVCAPLTYRGKNLGAVCIAGRKSGSGFSPDDLAIVGSLSCQIAIAFENAQLSQDKERVYFEAIAALALAVEARDTYSRGHSERVGEVATSIGARMGLPADQIQTLRDAARLHDIGKIGITDTILQKPGRLAEQEMEIMKRHPIIGENIVAPLKTFRHLMDPVRHHHERLDGSGYPDGLRGEQIPLITRIIMVADVYDAVGYDRPYRKAFTPEATREELEAMVRQDKLDRAVVSCLFADAASDAGSGPAACSHSGPGMPAPSRAAGF